MDCVFCSDPGRAGEIVFESAAALVVVHDDWAVPGHVMLSPRRHVENPSDLTADEWQAFAALWHRVERELLAATRRERAVAMKLGIATPHLHVHLYPVAADDTRAVVFDAIDGRSRAEPDPALVADLRRRLAGPA